MSLLVRVYPLRSSLSDLEAFAAALSTDRKAEARAFYHQYHVAHESWHLHETPDGPWVVAVSLVDDMVEAPERYAKSSAEFDTWFKQQVQHVTGVDPVKQPLGPPTRLVYAWSDDQRPNSNLID